MKARLVEPRKNAKGSIAFSLVFHVIAIAMIASITFRYPLAAFFKLKKEQPLERIQYIRVQPRAEANVGNGASETKPKRDRKKVTPPAQLLPPSTTPSALPPVPPPNVSSGAIS